MSLNLANGQVAATAGVILAGTSLTGRAKNEGRNIKAVFCNTTSNAQTVVLTHAVNGGTQRQIGQAVLAENETWHRRNIPLQPGDSLYAVTTDGSVVDYIVSEDDGNSVMDSYVIDANGTLKSGSGGLSGAQTFDSDVTLKNGAGTSHQFWDASAVDALWANAPSRAHPNFHSIAFEIFDDFLCPVSATVSDYMAWTSVDDSGTGTNAFQDAAGGIYNVVTAAADNDYHAMTSVAENFLFAEGKKLWFEARFKLAEANTNESAWWFGLTDTLTTGGFQADTGGPLASYDGALIWKDEATMAIDFETSNATSQNTTTAMATFVTNTWTRVGFYFDGAATTSVITPYYDVGGGVLIAGTPQNITLSGLAEMHLVFGVKAGPTAAAETLQVDYVRCLALR